jgi:protein-S-isoprenylcysteine O-methyltransferase Ste14
MGRRLNGRRQSSMRLLGVLTKIIVVLLFGGLALASYSHFKATGNFISLGVVAVNALVVFFFVARRQAKAVSASPAVWALSVTGTVVPLLLRPAEAESSVLVGLGSGIQVAGAALIVTALLSLSRSFGIVPANRGIRSNGLYTFVRHPLYAAELLFFLGFALSNPSLTNFVLVAIEVGLQALRARAEERLLLADPVYEAYRERVRHQFVPGLI